MQTWKKTTRQLQKSSTKQFPQLRKKFGNAIKKERFRKKELFLTKISRRSKFKQQYNVQQNL
ncbi:hypothetical protein T11_11096 [Trichinella zimbabwensis]|uniref:Uncharacterized protein n=1 Tax=Trichinella zimbabwensis TaxID=268475 RepID=A0A0V1HCL7_9BILA|nr:hypothetical protein T11_11096 [Trichinella zimbabwensis]